MYNAYQLCPLLIFEQVQDFGRTMLHEMQQARPVPREYIETIVPDSTFISLATSSQVTAYTTTTTMMGA